MKMLKKLALVSAVSMISTGAFAMEAMDEETMSATTGQDGITINIVPDRITRLEATSMGVTAATMDTINSGSKVFKGLSIGEIRVHDDDGYGVLGTDATANSGALVIGGGRNAIDLNGDSDTLDPGEAAITALSDRTVILSKGDKPIQINVDMIGDVDATTTGNQASLRVEIKQPQLAIKLGNIYVADSNAAPDDYNADGGADVDVGTLDNKDGDDVTDKVKILDGLEIVMGESKMIIQLGNEDSSNHMIDASATLVGGLALNNFALYDESGASARTADSLLTGDVGAGGSIRATSIKITDTGDATKLTTQTYIDVGSRIKVSTVTAGAATAYQAGVALKLQDPITAGATSGTFTTYASLQTAAFGLNGVDDGGAGDDNAAAYTALTGVNAAVNAEAASIATTATGLANDAADGVNAGTATNTWGGVDTYNGLVITSQLGGANGADITIANLALGDTNAAVMGDVQILGLKLGASKIVIMGH